MHRLHLLLLFLPLSLLAAPFTPTAQDAIVPEGAEWELLWADGIFTEGPAPAPDGSIYFTSIGTRIYRYDPASKKTSVFREDSGRANGLMFDRTGRLLACEGSWGGGLRVSITEPDGAVWPLAQRWKGKRFCGPNDLTILPSGRVYFTDPRYRGEEPLEMDFHGVFFVDPDGSVTLASKEVQKPNGIGVSPDGKFMYVADAPKPDEGTGKLLRFDIRPNGTLGGKKVLHEFDGRGLDGMCLDTQGKVYGAGGSGASSAVYVFDPDGKHLARLPLPGFPTNCVFGIGDQAHWLYATAQAPADSPKKKSERGEQLPFGLYRIKLNTSGYHPAIATP